MRRTVLIPAAAALTLAGLVVAIGLLITSSREAEPPRAAPFLAPPAVHLSIAADVQDARGAALTISTASGAQAVTVRADVRVFELSRATAADAKPGDTITVIGVPNEVLNYSIRRVLIIPAALAPVADADGQPRLPAGFAGHETESDQKERPLVSGQVERVEGTLVSLTARSGPMSVDTGRTALLSIVHQVALDSIKAGARIAWLPRTGAAALGDAADVLVLAGER